MSFDLYIPEAIVCNAVLQELKQRNAGLAAELSLWNPTPGFQHLNISESDAADLAESVLRSKKIALVVHSDYRVPKLSITDAQKAAEQYICGEIERNYKGISFEPIELICEDAMWWQFGAPSEELQNKGFIPGCIFAYVDKIDGHLWSPIERRGLYYEEFYIDAANVGSLDTFKKSLQQEFELADDYDYFDNDKPVMRKDALMILISPHPYPALVSKNYEFSPDLYIRLRLLKNQRNFDNSKNLIFRIVQFILDRENTDLILYFDQGKLTSLLASLSGNKFLNNLVSGNFEKFLNKHDFRVFDFPLYRNAKRADFHD